MAWAGELVYKLFGPDNPYAGRGFHLTPVTPKVGRGGDINSFPFPPGWVWGGMWMDGLDKGIERGLVKGRTF